MITERDLKLEEFLAAPGVQTRAHDGLLAGLRRFIVKEPIATLAGLILLGGVVVAAFAPWLAGCAKISGCTSIESPYDVALDHRLEGPSLAHPAGTDQLGRDLFKRLILASRYSLGIGFGATILGTTVALAIGILSAYRGGMIDLVLQRIVDGILTVPFLLLVILFVAALGPGIWTVMLVIGLFSGIPRSRVFRASTLEVLSMEYLEAAKVIGVSWPRLAMRYIIPNIIAPLIVLMSVGLGAAILAESSLSFLGYGVPPPEPTWGQMLGLQARPYFVSGPWMAISPGIALTIMVFSINIFGDALRDRLDPRLRGV